MNILVLSPQNVFPLNQGGRTSIFHSSKSLAKYHKVFIMFPYSKTSDTSLPDDLKMYSENNMTPLPVEFSTSDSIIGLIKNIFDNVPFKIKKYHNPAFLDKACETVEKEKIDMVIVYATHLGYYGIRLKEKFGMPVFLRAHNIEYELVRQYYEYEKNIFKKTIAFWQYHKTVDYEKSLLERFDRILFISDSDLETAKAANPGMDNGVLLYDGVEMKDAPQNADESIPEEISFIFTGSLEVIQNRINLGYFINNIWKKFKSDFPHGKLYIAGNKHKDGFKEIGLDDDALSRWDIHNLGFVEDIDKTIESKKYFISPTIIGSGLRIKVIKALSLGAVVFLTDIDYNMTTHFRDMENTVLYGNYDEFREKFQALENNAPLYLKIKKNAVETIKKEFNWNNHVKTIENEYDSMIGNKL